MNFPNFKILTSRFIFLSFFAQLFFFAAVIPIASAATYSFAESTSTDPDGTHEVVLLFSSDTPVNALQGAFTLPSLDRDVVPSDGGSIVEFWIEHPHNEQGKISFAGIIPGGFSGEAPVLRFRAKGSAKTIIIDKKVMSALRHDGTGEPDQVVIGPVSSLPLRFATTGASPARDATPPQPFVPVVATDESLFEGKPFVSFGAKDAQSGVIRYEIAESDCGKDEHDPTLAWRVAQSPAPLDTTGNGCVYVRAIDQNANMRVTSITLDAKSASVPEEVVVPTARNLYKIGILLGIIVVTFGGLYFHVHRRKMFSK